MYVHIFGPGNYSAKNDCHMNKAIPAYTVMEGYVGYFPLHISQLQTVFQYRKQHKTLPLLRHTAPTNPPAISQSVNLNPPGTPC